MASFETRRTQKVTARILMLAALAAPCAGFSQPVLESAVNDEQQRQTIEKIQDTQSAEGPNSASLIDPLAALGLLYRERGEHGLAAAALERAQGVVRFNYGLHSLDQAPLIEQLIRSEEARGNDAAAWDLEQELLDLARRSPDDLRTVPILHEIADKRMDVLRRYVAGEEFPPQIVLGCYYDVQPHNPDGPHSCQAGNKRDAIRSILTEAQNYYGAAINVFLRREFYSSDELREIEMELVRSSYRYGTYGVGADSLRRLLAYEVANSDPWLSRIDVLIQMADWDLLFENTNESALKIYKEAYQQLKKKGIAEASIEQLFSPKTPVVLPTFLPNPLVSVETQGATGFIDVAFDVTKYGESRRIKILDTRTKATDAAKDHLVRLIKRSRFRPRSTDGRFADSSRITVRYYLNE
jgi:hypothetical protein